METFEIKKLNKAEEIYTFKQSNQISSQCGLIGYMRADMGVNGNEFWSTWNDYKKDLKTSAFQSEFDELITNLRGDGIFLNNRKELAKYCYNNLEAFDCGEEYFGVRVDSKDYVYLMRLCPLKGMYNLYCYCYKKDWLDIHLKNAEKGIRFITSGYDELFRIKDNERIVIVLPCGEKLSRECRYIDDYHVQIGVCLYHICEFAEKMERENAVISYNGSEFRYYN